MNAESLKQVLEGDRVRLAPASEDNADRLVEWLRDDEARGPHRGPVETPADELREEILTDERYAFFVIEDAATGEEMGLLEVEEHHFDKDDDSLIDWELSFLIAEPEERGGGYGSAAQKLISDHLLEREDTKSVFACPSSGNLGAQQSLQNAGFERRGLLPSSYYRVEAPNRPTLVFVRKRAESAV